MEQKVTAAVKNGTPVLSWNDYQEVAKWDGYAVNEDFDLRVVKLRQNPESGIVVVMPKTIQAWEAYRKGKLAMIARTARRPLTWAGRYFKIAQRVKCGLDPQVVRAVAKLRFLEIESLPEKTIRDQAIKTIAKKMAKPFRKE